MTIDEAIKELTILQKHGYGKSEVTLKVNKLESLPDFDWSIGRCKAEKYVEEATWGLCEKAKDSNKKSDPVPFAIPDRIW